VNRELLKNELKPKTSNRGFGRFPEEKDCVWSDGCGMIGEMTNFKVPRVRASLIQTLLFPTLLLAMSFLASADSGVLADLIGTWIRADGGYKLVVKSIGEDGKAVAEYFNPNPIHVAEANASVKDGKPVIFVKFEDVNYTGSTYRLALGADKERLEGKYFQATQRKTYDIFFERQP
jgi:hypothetical protein